MPLFCDVALPVPLDQLFTYEVNGVAPVGGARGLVPFAGARLVAEEVKRHFCYRIGEAGRKVLYEGAAKGSSRRSKLSAEEQNREYAVLNYLEGGETAKAGALRSATGANKALLDGMVRKRWLMREALAEERDARRLEKVAVLVEQGSMATEESRRSFDSAQDDTSNRGD